MAANSTSATRTGRPVRANDPNPGLQPAHRGGESIGGVLVSRLRGALVAARGARVGVAEGVLDVLERRAGVEGFGGEGVAEAVRMDVRGAGDAGGPGQAAELFVGAGVG